MIANFPENRNRFDQNELEQLPQIAIFPNMNIDYIEWFFNLDFEVFTSENSYPLLVSDVHPPMEILMRYLARFQKEAEDRINVSYAWGHPGLISNIAKRYGTSPENVMPTNGATNAIYLVCRSLLKESDHVVIEAPVYEHLMASPEFISCNITILKRRPSEYSVDLDELANAIRSDTKLLIITNLHNPSGTYLDDDYLRRIADTAKSRNKDIRILVDEIYHDFIPGKPAPAATLDDCFITLNSLTKVYGLGMIHCGWVIAERQIVKELKKLQVLVEGCGSRLLDSFSSLIIENLDEFLDHSHKIATGNREIMKEYIQPLIDNGLLTEDIPVHGCIYFPKVSNIEDTKSLAENLADKFNVHIVPGHFFREPGHIRIGFGAKPEQLKRNLGKFVEAISYLLK
ncbi:MAG: aminotransferase class I/II-fold pyridoxal phosphate-dependent enzyme [candidate division Zixibacteria bacterium]|nr:aminotransferase class I/II-fold pyridoxal phosphate-dependent enzyme [candidate division Zixibacteria bacterium]